MFHKGDWAVLKDGMLLNDCGLTQEWVGRQVQFLEDLPYHTHRGERTWRFMGSGCDGWAPESCFQPVNVRPQRKESDVRYRFVTKHGGEDFWAARSAPAAQLVEVAGQGATLTADKGSVITGRLPDTSEFTILRTE